MIVKFTVAKLDVMMGAEFFLARDTEEWRLAAASNVNLPVLQKAERFTNI
jgi:hypothetical protein